MAADRSFGELNLWQRIFAVHWDGFCALSLRKEGRPVPEHWRENVERMLSCGDIAEGYCEYYCQDCGATRKIGFTCKSRLCLRCCKVASGSEASGSESGGRLAGAGEEGIVRCSASIQPGSTCIVCRSRVR